MTGYRGRRNAKPRPEILDRITAAAAAGDDGLVALLTAQALREDHDRRTAAEPLPQIDPS